MIMVFRDQAGRAHMTAEHGGQQSSFDHLEDYLSSLLDETDRATAFSGSAGAGTRG